MRFSIFDRSQRALHVAGFVRALVAYVASPHVDSVLRLERHAVGLADAAARKAFSDSVCSSVSLSKVMQDRWLPDIYTRDDLSTYPEGTLGYAFYRHLVDNELQVDFWPASISVDDDMEYFRLRMYQAHDILHAVAGFGTTDQEEMGIVGFYLGQGEAALHDEHVAPIVFSALLGAATLLNMALRRNELLRPALRLFHDGYRRGAAAEPLHAVCWEELFNQPLS